MIDNVGTHATHCCILHGCAYGHSDCPVAAGSVKQEYCCLDCPSREDEEHAKHVLDDIAKLEEMGLYIP